MSSSRPSLLGSLLNLISSLFGGKPSTPQPPEPEPPVLDDAPLVPLEPRVLVIVYDPIIDPNTRMRLTTWAQQNRGWQAVDQLIEGYIGDVTECSGGLVKYRVVERLDVDEWPLKLDGFRYTWESYQKVLQRPDTYHQPDAIDYHRILDDFNLLQRVGANELDEVWLFTFPFSGTYESIMAGKGAFYCNSSPLEGTESCPRRFVIMGFSYERDVGEMEEDLGHRTESIMSRVYDAQDFLWWTYERNPDRSRFNVDQVAATNLFARFILHDKIAPGKAHCGNVHYAPNSDSDYDWGNGRLVATFADDWLNFPNFTNQSKMQNTRAWGDGDIRGHHRWWFTHFPKVAGRIHGIRNNWWSYICDVTNPELDQP